jgi:hypothetical protein
MTKARKHGGRGFTIRPKNSVEVTFTSEMLNMFQIRNSELNLQSQEARKKVCKVFGFIIKLSTKYLPPKQRKIFYSVWVRSGGKMKDGILEYSRKTGENYITNYYNYYKAVKNLKKVLEKVGYDKFIIEYLRDDSMMHGD